MNITFDTIQTVSAAFSEARNAFIPHTPYDAWSIDYRNVPAAEVRAEAERKVKAQKAVDARIACERKVVRRAVRTLLAEGFVITVAYGDGQYGAKQSTSERAIMASIQACDEEWLNVWARDDSGKLVRSGSVFLVYGNSGPEVIADYSLSLETVLEPVMQYCEKLDLAGA